MMAPLRMGRKMHHNKEMTKPLMVFFGDFSDELIAWDEIAGPLEWAIHFEQDLDSLAATSKTTEIPAVFVDFQTSTSTYPAQVQRLREILPNARIVLCCGIESMDDAAVTHIEPFHVVSRPLRIEEVRQSVGFVWESWRARSQTHSATSAAA